jgi:kynureninase
MEEKDEGEVIDVARWRPEFPILDTCTYLVSHSLGAMPRGAAESLAEFAQTWAQRGVRAWHEGWWTMGREVGNLLAPILGVEANTISMHQNVTIAQAIIASCYPWRGPRNRIVMSQHEFPTNIYLFTGLRRYGADVLVLRESDPIRVDTGQLVDAIDHRTQLVVFSYVLFRSALIQDAAAIVEKAHRVGAHVVADVYQAAGTVPLSLGTLGVEYAVGGSVKWLCGGPGAGYLYVRPDLAPRLEPALVGWAAHRRPFAFETEAIDYDAPPERFQSGTPNVPALYSARTGYRIVADIGVEAIRARSLRLTRLMLDHAQARGYRVNTPLDDDRRGGSVVFDVPDAERISRELLERNVVIDYRPGAGIRMAPHFYNTEDEIAHALHVLDDLVVAARDGRSAVP